MLHIDISAFNHLVQFSSFPQTLRKRNPLVTEGEYDANLEPKSILSLVTLPLSFPSLHNPLTAFAPPHHQGCHEEGDQDGHSNKGTQDAVGWIPEKPSSKRAFVEVVPVHSDEELIHQPVGPEALQLHRH